MVDILRKSAFMLALVATPAMAQNSTTDCRSSFGVVHCTTNSQGPQVQLQMPTLQPPPQMNWGAIGDAMRYRAERERMAQQQAEQRQRDEQQQSAQRETQATHDSWQNSVMQQLKNGDCPGALQTALGSGDLELATKVKNYCAAPSPQK